MALPVAADNIYNTFGIQLDDVHRRLLELPARQQVNESEVTRFSALVEGLYADWAWDVSYNWSRSEATEVTHNLVNADNLARGIGPAGDCRGPEIDGCVPINLLGPAGSLDRAQHDFLRTRGEVYGEFKLASFSANVSNSLLNLPTAV